MKQEGFDEIKVLTEMQDNYTSDTRLFLNFCISQGLPLNAESLDEWLKYLKFNGYAAATIKKRFYAIKGRLKFILEHRPFESEDERAIALYNLERRSREMNVPRRATFAIKPTKFFSKDEIRRLIREAEPRTGMMIEFLYTTGVRIAEMVGIRKRHLRQESPTVYSIRIFGKGSKERFVFINTGLRRRIQDVFHGNEWLFETRKGTPYSEKNAWRMLKKAGDEILERNLTPHCLRHSFTAHKIRETGKITGVSLYLGHSDISTTLGEYNYELLHPEELGNGLWGGKGKQNIGRKRRKSRKNKCQKTLEY